jgi:hypothetical protein
MNTNTHTHTYIYIYVYISNVSVFAGKTNVQQDDEIKHCVVTSIYLNQNTLSFSPQEKYTD